MSSLRDVYSKLLFRRGQGYPLWEPEPTRAGEVLIGDVGHIYQGAFYRLFNATLPADHPVNQPYGVPDEFEVFFRFQRPCIKADSTRSVPGRSVARAWP
ncbi:hypothetical protein BV20DRAFT_1073972 [Pilatotrama ljubarskyi]|nr:hypothetical protein BV20DRAFT_1073972 [Pilatotrama ljubarskyi]